MIQRWWRWTAVVVLLAAGALVLMGAPASAHDQPPCPAKSVGYERPADMQHGTAGKVPHFRYTQKGHTITWSGPRGYGVVGLMTYDETYRAGAGPGKPSGHVSYHAPSNPLGSMGYSWKAPEDFTLMQFCVAKAPLFDFISGKWPLPVVSTFLALIALAWIWHSSTNSRRRG
jgi:hypothetical protein